MMTDTSCCPRVSTVTSSVFSNLWSIVRLRLKRIRMGREFEWKLLRFRIVSEESLCSVECCVWIAVWIMSWGWFDAIPCRVWWRVSMYLWEWAASRCRQGAVLGNRSVSSCSMRRMRRRVVQMRWSFEHRFSRRVIYCILRWSTDRLYRVTARILCLHCNYCLLRQCWHVVWGCSSSLYKRGISLWSFMTRGHVKRKKSVRNLSRAGTFTVEEWMS